MGSWTWDRPAPGYVGDPDWYRNVAVPEHLPFKTLAELLDDDTDDEDVW